MKHVPRSHVPRSEEAALHEKRESRASQLTQVLQTSQARGHARDLVIPSASFSDGVQHKRVALSNQLPLVAFRPGEDVVGLGRPGRQEGQEATVGVTMCWP